MDSKNTSSQNGQGPQSDVQEPDLKALMSVEVIEGNLARDFTVLRNLCHAIVTNKELRIAIAGWMKGQYDNAKNKPDPAQVNLPFANTKPV